MTAKRELTLQEKRLFRVSLSLMLALIATQIITIFSIVRLDAGDAKSWPMTMGLILLLPSILGNASCMWYSRHHKVFNGIIAQQIGYFVTLAIVVVTFEGRSVIAALLVTSISVAVAAYVLKDRKTNIAIATAVAIGILTITVDYFIPFTRTTISDIRPIGAYLVGGIGLIISLIIALQYKSLNLRTRLLLLFVAIPAIIIAVVSAFFINNLSTNLRAEIKQDNTDQLALNRSQILTFLNNASDDVIFLSQSNALSNYLDTKDDPFATNDQIAQALTDLNSEFFAFAQARLIYDQVRFMDITGQEIVRVNTNDVGVSTIVRAEDLQNKAGRYYFDDTIRLSETELMISPLDLNVEQGAIEEPYKPVIRYGTPVFNNGELVGAVVTNILAENMLSILDTAAPNTYLVDSDGYYLYHPDNTKEWGRDLETDITLQQDLPDFAETLISESVGTIETENGDFLSHLPITLEEETQPRWYLVSATDSATILAPLQETLRPVESILALALMLTPLIAIFVSQSIAAPLIILSKSAEAIAAGNFQTTIEINSEDEFGDLATAFRRMASQLSDLVSSLELRVADRTRDLVLASDIASNISHIRDLNELLTNSAETIRSRFDLYYTQIYLVNDVENKLDLVAGTGTVGQELLRRSYSLPLNFSSINGTVATEKRPVIVPDTAKSPLFRPNPLLPNTRSEMSIPMLLGDRVIGVLNVQSAEVNGLSEGNLSAFETLAGQLAIAIDNTRLFEEVMRARVEMEERAQMLSQQGWQNYLNAINHKEVLGYRFANNHTEPLETLEEVALDEHIIEASIDVINAPIGKLRIAMGENRVWNEDEEFIVHAVAQQIGQRLESLRVLTEADQYRAQAEEATRRLTRENWKRASDKQQVGGYLYNQNEVTALDVDSAATVDATFSQELQVHGETIGSLELAGLNPQDDEKLGLVTAVSKQLSNHLENLRLTEQTQRALAETETLFRISSKLNGVGNIEEVITTLVNELREDSENTISASLFTIQTKDGRPDTLEMIGTNDALIQPSIGQKFDLTTMPTANLWAESGNIVLISDVATDPRLDEDIRSLYLQINTKSSAILPLRLGSDWIGLLNLAWSGQQMAFTESDERLFQSVASQLAVVLNSQILFAATQRRAEREELVNTITQKIQQTTTMQGALETAVRELGLALHAKYTQVKVNPQTTVTPETTPTNGHNGSNGQHTLK